MNAKLFHLSGMVLHLLNVMIVPARRVLKTYAAVLYEKVIIIIVPLKNVNFLFPIATLSQSQSSRLSGSSPLLGTSSISAHVAD